MINFINNAKLRPGGGRLSNSVDFQELADGCGIGTITKLPEYWYVINYGKKYSPRGVPFSPGGGKTVRGTFSPGEEAPSATSFRQGRFVKGFYSMTAKQAVPAMNYIENTLGFINTLIERLFK
jgi:hypothetical protein